MHVHARVCLQSVLCRYMQVPRALYIFSACIVSACTVAVRTIQNEKGGLPLKPGLLCMNPYCEACSLGGGGVHCLFLPTKLNLPLKSNDLHFISLYSM